MGNRSGCRRMVSCRWNKPRRRNWFFAGCRIRRGQEAEPILPALKYVAVPCNELSGLNDRHKFLDECLAQLRCVPAHTIMFRFEKAFWRAAANKNLLSTSFKRQETSSNCSRTMAGPSKSWMLMTENHGSFMITEVKKIGMTDIAGTMRSWVTRIHVWWWLELLCLRSSSHSKCLQFTVRWKEEPVSPLSLYTEGPLAGSPSSTYEGQQLSKTMSMINRLASRDPTTWRHLLSHLWTRLASDFLLKRIIYM